MRLDTIRIIHSSPICLAKVTFKRRVFRINTNARVQNIVIRIVLASASVNFRNIRRQVHVLVVEHGIKKHVRYNWRLSTLVYTKILFPLVTSRRAKTRHYKILEH
jgi:hypothetical protein